jgi:hypothetical protein
MQALKATQAREIKQSDITEAETLVFEGRVLSQTDEQMMAPGEFCVRSTAIPIITKLPHWFIVAACATHRRVQISHC